MAFVSFVDRESARAAKQAASDILFKGRNLFAAFVEPRETRRLHFEEKIDKKAYEKHQMHVMGSKNADLIQLISSLGVLLNQLQVGGQGQRRMSSVLTNMHPRPGQHLQPGGHIQGAMNGGIMGGNQHQGQGYRNRSYNNYGHQQRGRMQGGGYR